MNKTAHICGTIVSFKILENEYGINSTVKYKNNNFFVIAENWFSVMLYHSPLATYLEHCEQGILTGNLIRNINS